MDTNYKLVQSVDPKKGRLKVREKFSKLTLSSSKKKQEDTEMHQQIREQALQSNVSRNLLSELLTDDESDEEKREQQQPVENLLLRTDSSPSDGNVAPEKHPVSSLNTTHCSEAEQDVEKSVEMEPLLVSGMENTEVQRVTEDAVEKLSSRVSLITLGAATVSYSAGGGSNEISHIVSTENQARGGAQRFSDLLKVQPMQQDVSICVSSTSSESSDAPITISDSSEGEDEHDLNVSPPITTSLPQTLNRTNADRMAAFLRDVRRNYGLHDVTPDREFENREREIATADTEPMTMDNDSRSAGTAKRIATADTESMTPEEEITVKGSLRTPKDTSNRRLALDDTEDMTRGSETMQSPPHYVPVMNVPSQYLDDSLQKSCASVPEDSLTVAETSEEEAEEEDSKEARRAPEAEKALRQSDSLSQLRSKESSASSGLDTQFQINISAKINIKIHVSQQMDKSTSSDSTAVSPASNSTESHSSNEKPQSSAQKAKVQRRIHEDIPHSPPERDIPSKSPDKASKSPDICIKNAERLLNEIYGNNWKTPEVMRSLKKTAGLGRKKLSVPDPTPAEPNAQHKDESALEDFSIFRGNIPQDLDSTRLPGTPVSAFKAPKAIVTEPKPTRRPRKVIEGDTPMKTPQIEVTKTKSGREVRQRWRAIVDSDTESEGENASGDSDKSWSKSDENKNPVSPSKGPRCKTQTSLSRSKNDSELVYLDLSKGEVEVQNNVSASPPANHDEKFNRRLEDILNGCKFEDKPKIECTPGGRTKRKLFTAQLAEDDENFAALMDPTQEQQQNTDKDDESVSISGAPMPAKFQLINKHLESVKMGQPIFKIQTPNNKREAPSPSVPKTPKSRVIDEICVTPGDKYGFLKSLDICVGKSLCHPDALYYRDNFRQKRDELANKLYEIYNKKCFNNELDVPIKWNKKLTNTAGRCMNKRRLGERTCVIELSDKVLTSADRLRCTLIHELCHAATWIFNGEGGHSATWKAWARKANQIFPELPKIGVCHQYDIEYKYTYKCTLCAAKSYAHSKSKKVENIRCSYCHGAIEVYLNKKDKEGNTVATPVREPTGFAKFVKDKYKQYKRPDLKHADVMKLLSNEFALMKMDGKS